MLDTRFELTPTARFSVVCARDASAGDAFAARDAAATAAALVLGSASMSEKVRLSAGFARRVAPARSLPRCARRPSRAAIAAYQTLPRRRGPNLSICPMSRVKQSGRKALIHSLVHAEAEAISLMWSLIAHFLPELHAADVPTVRDWTSIAEEEALTSALGGAPAPRAAAIRRPARTTGCGPPPPTRATRCSRGSRSCTSCTSARPRLARVDAEARERPRRRGPPILRANLADEVGHRLRCAGSAGCAPGGVRDGGQFHRLVHRDSREAKPPFSTGLNRRALVVVCAHSQRDVSQHIAL